MEFNDKGRIDCPVCHGEKTVESEHIAIHELCPKCHGMSGDDWITYAMGNLTTQDLEWQLAYRNVNHLIEIAQRIAYKFGYRLEANFHNLKAQQQAELLKCQQYFNNVYKKEKFDV